MTQFYLEAETTPSIKSGRVYFGLERTIKEAFRRLEKVTEGQIGIYRDHTGAGFKGYAIKYPNGEPYFEPNLDEEID